MIFAYTRVSSRDQSCERQLKIIQEYASKNEIVIDRFFEEKASGKNFDRPVYQGMKIALRDKDCLVITELDRLGRDMSQIKEEWQGLERGGVSIIVIENELLSTANKTDLERTLISNIVFELLSYIAQKERMKIKERQAIGIQIARENGKFKGRKPISVPEDKFVPIYNKWKNKEITAVKAMELLSVKRDVFYRLVKEREQEVIT